MHWWWASDIRPLAHDEGWAISCLRHSLSLIWHLLLSTIQSLLMQVLELKMDHVQMLVRKAEGFSVGKSFDCKTMSKFAPIFLWKTENCRLVLRLLLRTEQFGPPAPRWPRQWCFLPHGRPVWEVANGAVGEDNPQEPGGRWNETCCVVACFSTQR